jgi:hypothetical protein
MLKKLFVLQIMPGGTSVWNDWSSFLDRTEAEERYARKLSSLPPGWKLQLLERADRVLKTDAKPEKS